MSRPSEFTVETADRICARIAGGESLADVLRDDDAPGYSTVMQWLRAHPEFAENYARAREEQGEYDADQVGHIARKVLSGDIGHQEARVAIDAYKWTAAKRKPKVYGDRVEVTGRLSLESLVMASLKPADPAA
ncbi:MAG TPA: hypothetical protein VFZ38_10810 [Vicinamibacterales bacterium]